MSYPDKAYMYGMPMCLWGWNGEYYKTKDVIEDSPVYKRDSYTMLWIIPIIGVTIYKSQGRWVLIRECDFDLDWSLCKKEDQETPFGSWSYGAFFRQTKKYWFW